MSLRFDKKTRIKSRREKLRLRSFSIGHQQIFVPLNMRPIILDLLQLLMVLYLLAIQQLQSAKQLNQIAATLLNALALQLPLVEPVYQLELLSQSSTTLKMVVGFAIQKQDLLLLLEQGFGLLIALFQELFGLLHVGLGTLNNILQVSFVFELVELFSSDGVVIFGDGRAFKELTSLLAEVQELVGHVV